jgi:hypothetical protein
VSHNRLYQQMQEVISLIDAQDYMNNRPLEPTYLLGYACQIAALRTKNSEAENNETDNNETEVF